MWIRNKQTGLKWDVPIERAQELIETGEYEYVDSEKDKNHAAKAVKPSKDNAKSN